jgi:linoleoyl-CoA desaturase
LNDTIDDYLDFGFRSVMTGTNETQSRYADQAAGSGGSDSSLKFGGNSDFQVEVRRLVEEFFHNTGQRQRDCPQMYVKTAILISSFIASYALLVFVAQTWWQALPLAILLGLITAAIGFNIQHDGSHHAYSNYDWVNRIMATTLDVIGGSSYHWHWKHVIFHHTYVNITGQDTDIDLGGLGRLTPHRRLLWFYRWQHYYLWPLYGLMAINWHLVGDFRDLIPGRIGQHRLQRPKGWNLVVFLAGKAVFVSLAFGIPLLFHPAWVVALFYGVTAIVLGLTLSVVFQLAHAVEQAEFPLPSQHTGRIENAWAIHQIESTVDFARHSRLAAWLLGGLNFQIEHHLFPRICHVNYPAISKLVKQACREFSVRYSEHQSFWSGVASHFRWLRRMGTPQEPGLSR